MNLIVSNFKYAQPLISLNLDKVAFIILHHTAAIKAEPSQIHQWHLDNGWNGFGYNEYIRKDGTVVIGRGDFIGAQCANMNSKSYGICCEGNYDIEPEMPLVQFNSLVERIVYHKSRLKNLIEIVPHCRFYPTSCPGKNYFMGKILDTVLNATNSLQSDINTLVRSGVIDSPDFWAKNAIKGTNVNGEYVALLIKKMAQKLKISF